MFALEISFQDGVSQPETVFVRRPQALIGASDFAHVVVEDMKELNFQLRLVRDLGRRFRCKPVGAKENVQVPTLLEGLYEGETTLDLGPVKFHVTALDSDLLLKETEPPDRAGVRVLRQACSTSSPLFPAIVVLGSNPMIISFVPDQPIYIGRSKHCALRLDSADISAKHARMGYESGEFWIEDLGSTNGTFVNEQQISGRANVAAGMPIILGREISVMGVTSEDQIKRATKFPAENLKKLPVQERRFPVLLSVSEVARPARLVIPLGATITIGRDPSCDMWLGAPHVSRKHCAVTMTKTGSLSVSDCSTNGTAHDRGLLKKGDLLEVSDRPTVLDFGGGVTVALCFDDQQEQHFVTTHGAPQAFVTPEASADGEDTLGGRQRQITVARPLGADDALLGKDGERANVLGGLKWLYRSRGWRGRALLVFTGFSVALVLVMMGILLMRI